jgi:hypothetical protein
MRRGRNRKIGHFLGDEINGAAADSARNDSPLTMIAREFTGCFANAAHLPALNPHLTKSRLNDAPHLCQTPGWNFR